MYSLTENNTFNSMTKIWHSSLLSTHAATNQTSVLCSMQERLIDLCFFAACGSEVVFGINSSIRLYNSSPNSLTQVMTYVQTLYLALSDDEHGSLVSEIYFQRSIHISV